MSKLLRYYDIPIGNHLEVEDYSQIDITLFLLTLSDFLIYKGVQT